MRYERFLELREPRWQLFEHNLGLLADRPASITHAQLESLATEYRRLLRDHALAQSRYPDSWAARKLAQLALRGHHALRAPQETSRGGLALFYRNELPRLFALHATELVAVLTLFAIAAVTGLAMAVVRPELGTSFVGRDAVVGLREGRLWTEVIADSGAGAYFGSAIASNNMGVALMAWAGGALAGLGSLWVTLLNGFMLGGVIAVTLHYDMQAKLLEFISAHGPLEITLILVAAAAGLRVGRAMVTVDEVPLAQRLPRAARESLQLVLALLPVFVLLGFVESFVSPAPGIPTPLKVAVGLALETLFLLLVLRRPLDRGAR